MIGSNTRVRIDILAGRITRRRWILLVAVLLILGSASTAIAAPKRVLLLHSFGRDFAPWNAYARNIREELIRQSPEPIDLYEASLATARYADADSRPLVDYLLALFVQRPLDLVVTIGAPAAGFVQQHRADLFPATPMVFTGVEQRRVAIAALTANDTVVASSLDFAGIIENILRVRPDTANIAVVIGNSPIEKYWVEQIRTEFQPFEKRVAFSWFNDLSLEEMVKRVAALPERSAIFFALLSVDAAGVPHEEAKALLKLRAATNAPIFGYIDAFYGDGIVGGPLQSINALSSQAASVAIRVLSGEPPAGIKTPPLGAARPKYDWRELQRWNISESRLPPGSEIHFRQPSLWQQYRSQMVAIFAALLLQAGMIMALLFERHRRMAAELASRGHLMEVMHLNRTATAGILSASFAHEIAQPLASILSNAEAAELYLKQDPPNVAEIGAILSDIRRDDERAGEIIRHLGGLLRKKARAELQEFDVNAAVRGALHLIEPEAKRRGVELSIAQAPGELAVRADPVHLQQVILNLAANAMDAMANCAAGTRKLVFRTTLINASTVEVSVADTGMGIPPDKLKDVFKPFFTTKENGTGIGLSISQAILQLYGGTIWAENTPGGGTVFRFSVPLAKAQTA